MDAEGVSLFKKKMMVQFILVKIQLLLLTPLIVRLVMI